MPSFSFDFTLNYYSISALVNVMTSILLGTFVYLTNKRAPTNIGFALFAWFVAAWSIGYFFWQISADAQTALFWSRALMVGAIFTPVAFLQFVFGLLGLSEKRKKFIRWSYSFFSLFLFFNLTPLFIAKVEPALSFPFWPKPGPLYHIFLAIWFFYLLYAGYILIKRYRNEYGVKREQIRYVLAALIIAFASGSTNYFLWYNIPIPPFANIFVSVYVAIITYAIVKKKLFDIRVVLTQILVGVIAVLLYTNILSSQTPFEYAWKGGLFAGFLIAGYLLIRSVLKEVEQREELQILSDELATANERLKKLDKAKSEFISIASHQLRTPLTAIKGYLSLVLEETYGKVADSIRKPLDNVYLSNERLIRLVNDLLSISRIESGKIKLELQEANIEEVAKSVIEELQIKAQEKNLQLILVPVDSAAANVQIDEEKMRNVILNIIDNAIRYTPGGSITTKIEKRDTKLHITIADTGEGMTQEEISGLFQSFTRGKAGTKFSTEGAGLGLYIAKQFVKMHHGKLWAESQGKGKGSAFHIEVPFW